uniref:Helicase-like protein n=1 Tax=Tanacetum cinerariifolium TaxID=118510 RepID=A0A699I921_TANCI|nr:helicase-like protein [Tanacetum cinerariifolium]
MPEHQSGIFMIFTVPMEILLEPTSNKLLYNTPTVSEVAALITNDFGDSIAIRDIMVDNKDKGPKRISKLHPSYMDLQYPLLFPYGEHGFHEKIPFYNNAGTQKTKRSFVLMKEYYAYIIHQRSNHANTLLRGGWLYQQFLVDAGVTHAEGLGKEWFYQGALQEARGTRVFQMKLTELLDDLTKREIFGKSRAVVYVIEFQKRGLPHAHILLWLEEECKCTNPTQIDDIISTKIPCPADDPEGYKVVTKFMLHDPCGKGVACTVDGKCSKRFPKPFYT